MSTSICAAESFELLNAGAKSVWRGKGDTWTAARDRAAEDAGLTVSQGERLEKNWQSMKHPNGDVYRLLLVKYGHLLSGPYGRLCAYIENAAASLESEARQIEETNAAMARNQATGEGVAAKTRRAETEE